MNAISKGLVDLGNPSLQMQRLCKHMGHKIPVNYDEQQAQLTFDMGKCEMSAGETTLTIECFADNNDDLATIVDVVERHLVSIAWKDEPKVSWQK